MKKPFLPLVLLGLLPIAASAATPVHVTLKPHATVTADADGFFTLGAVAALSGGSAAEREKFQSVRVGRAPLPDQTRQVTPGDVLLKLRQAGFHPEDDAVLEGAQKVAVTVTPPERGPETTAPAGSGTQAESPGPRPSSPASATSQEAPSPTVIHRGDAVTILIQDGDMTISAKGAARDNGGAGDTIRVHRDGLMTDLSVIVVDAQTVRLEM